MHRRARHLNPGSAGAKLALDTRFITGLSDTDPVSTWSDRSGNGNDATGSSTTRPTYETNEQGGQPILRFDGSNDYLSIADAASLDADTYLQLHIGYSMRQSSSVGTLVGKRRTDGGGTFNYAVYSISLATYCVWGENVNEGLAILSSSETVNQRYLFDYSYKKNDFKVYRDGVSQATSTLQNTNIDLVPNNTPVLIGSGPSSNPSLWPAYCDIMFVSFFKDEMSTSLRRRLQHASAFSFKIACS